MDFSKIKIQEKDNIPYRKKRKWGFCDQYKKIVIDCDFDEAWPFSDGVAKVVKNGEVSFIRRDGSVAFSVKGQNISNFKDGFAISYTYEKENTGFIKDFKNFNSYKLYDVNGNIILENYNRAVA